MTAIYIQIKGDPNYPIEKVAQATMNASLRIGYPVELTYRDFIYRTGEDTYSEFPIIEAYYEKHPEERHKEEKIIPAGEPQ